MNLRSKEQPAPLRTENRQQKGKASRGLRSGELSALVSGGLLGALYGLHLKSPKSGSLSLALPVVYRWAWRWRDGKELWS